MIPWTRARQALLSSISSRSRVKFMLVASVGTIYMRPLGGVIRGCGASCHQYADDTQLYISFLPTSVDAVLSLQRCLEWMQLNRLRLNPDKTEVLRVGGPSISSIGDSLSFGGMTLAAKSEAVSYTHLTLPTKA